MKILQIIPSLVLGGAERLAIDICSQIQNRPGYDIRLATFRNDNVYKALTDKINWDVVPASIKISPIKGNVLNTESLNNYIASFKPDIIHTHLFEAELVCHSLFRPDIKWFSHCHDNMRQLETFGINTLFNRQLLTEFYERCYLLRNYKRNRGSRFIAISQDTANYFNRVLPKSAGSITLLHNGVNTAQFKRPHMYRPVRIADLELVTAGSLVAKKNQAFLLQVVKRLTKKNYKVHLHLLGDGPDRTMLEQKASSLRINDSVTFHGNVPNVEEFLWNSDIYVHAATYEPFGLVLVEAMAAGLPVVSLDGRGNRDIIQDQKNGYILSEPDVVDFANKVALLFHDKFKYEQIKQAAIETAKQFDIVNYTDKLLALYQKALKEK